MEVHAMNQILTELVSDRPDLLESIDFKKVRANTKKCPQNFTSTIQWECIEHLHILGSQDMEEIRGGPEPGAYISADHDWLLIIGLSPKRILNCIPRLNPARLTMLDIRFTDLERIDVNRLSELTELNLSYNKKLLRVNGLGYLSQLRELDLVNTNLHGPLDIRSCTNLRILDISSSKAMGFVTGQTLEKLTHLSASNTNLTDTEFLSRMPNLQVLNLSATDITHLPSLARFPKLRGLDLTGTIVRELCGLEELTALESLNLSYTPMANLDVPCLPPSLRMLSLAGTRIRELPESLRTLTKLRRLDLSYMMLQDLPDWLPELGLRFNPTGYSGIILTGTSIHNMDSSILSQSHELISQWLEMRSSQTDSVPLNELKVVFLGDGEAGKSFTIARLLNDGGEPEGYKEGVTPGIAISNKIHHIDGRKINVHYWDFGGQEILHSMHRIFMTPRTLYVVLINARDNTQDERARYWLHNISSFAEGSRVLMVLNKMDQNPNASINETELRYRYPNLAGVIRLSALNAPQQEFRDRFIAPLMQEIASFETSKVLFPRSWLRIRDQVLNMDKTMNAAYLSHVEFKEICMKSGVHQPEIIESLRDWFTDLGVSFCYHKHGCSENYVVLRPDWITNAIYIILFNKHSAQGNGIISHKAICRLLAERHADIKCVLPGITYTEEETKFVLSIIRQFQLSYKFDDVSEFMPILCQSNSPSIALDFASDPLTQEFRMIYDYLPNNVIHRLMVRRQNELDTENVWLTGAHFVLGNTSGLSAVVRIDGNVLKINIRSSRGIAPSQYRDPIIKDVEEISRELTLKITERQLAYKAGDSVEYFDYDELMGYQQCGMENIYSKKHRKLIKIKDILNFTGGDDPEDKRKLLRNLHTSFLRMQEDRLYWDATEYDRNSYLRDCLRTRYAIFDQTPASRSPSAGQIDLDIRRDPNNPWTALEALTIRGISPTFIQRWEDHLNRLLAAYNPADLRFLILVCYVECTRDKFAQALRRFGTHLQTYAPNGFTLDSVRQIQNESINSGLSMICCNYKSGHYYTEVYHIFVRVGE